MLIQAWRRLAGLHMARHAWLALLLLRRGEAGAALASTCHYALEEVGGTVADGRRRGLRWTTMLDLRRPATLLEFAMQPRDLVLVPDLS